MPGTLQDYRREEARPEDRGAERRRYPADHHQYLRLGPPHVRGPAPAEPDFVFGHENQGIVEEVDAGVTKVNVGPGMAT